MDRTDPRPGLQVEKKRFLAACVRVGLAIFYSSGGSDVLRLKRKPAAR